jgi:predicted MPP superfamily phosphohydrolase
MILRFWIAAALFHAGVSVLTLVVARRWVRRLEPGATSVAWVRASVTDALFWGVPALWLAALAAAFTLDAFTAVRLLSQALFGELVVLLAAIALLLWRRRFQAGALVAALSCLMLLGAYGEAYHREPTDLQVRTHSVDLTRDGRTRGRFRIVHLSDIQADRIGSYQEHALRLAAEQKPDLIVLTGDYVQPRVGSSRARPTADLNALLRAWRFDAPLGAYAVRGDVDADWPRVFDKTPVTTLTGELVTRGLPGGVTLSLVGITPSMSHGRDRKHLLELASRAPQDSLRLVIGHGPDFVLSLADTGLVDLALAGHTHGGQVVLPLIGPPFTKTRIARRYASGLNDYAGIPIHVSPGVGMERGTAPQIRFLCPPEISVLDVSY